LQKIKIKIAKGKKSSLIPHHFLKGGFFSLDTLGPCSNKDSQN